MYSIEDCKAQNERPSSTAIVPNQGNPSQNCTTVS
uniref:Uncharacterized protein n=1 Tax=Romanomermis culicivorax TaxID=13658 RepID=A0A915K6W6_ROMCU